MATMPVPSVTGQPDAPDRPAADAWFASAPGQALLDSEWPHLRAVLGDRPGQPWLWLGPSAGTCEALAGPGLPLRPVLGGWTGPVRCGLPLPLANESVAAIVLQHPALPPAATEALLAECARVLVPGASLSVYCLNPLSPWRWRWGGGGPGASEPQPWRRRLRRAGLAPDPVSQGLGPRWGTLPDAGVQHGPGVRAAWVLRAQKRVVPLTPVRTRVPLRIGAGAPAA
jgi:SAM-dependent methyltransferase